MKIFTCQQCGYGLYFHNHQCTHCGCQLGFVPELVILGSFSVTEDGQWLLATKDKSTKAYKPCENYILHHSCNWMLASDDPNILCVACQLNRTIPNLSIDRNKTLWRTLQVEKRRLVFSLMRFKLPVISKQVSEEQGLAFDIMADTEVRLRENRQVMTGHADGLITLNLKEADDAVREEMRQAMGESYRTLLGHLRHECGHYYWDRLIFPSEWLTSFREMFGDERADYDQALTDHYENGAPARWFDDFVSTYASCHPWEDWAETWAHYLHMLDTMETAWYLGMRLSSEVGHSSEFSLRMTKNPYEVSDFSGLIDAWIPLTVSLNCLNRSMGQPDAYPFVLSNEVIKKLEFIHQVVQWAATDNQAFHPSRPIVEKV